MDAQDFLNEDGHLNTLGLTLYAEHLQKDNIETLPSHLKSHVADCILCSVEIFQLYKAFEEILPEIKGERISGD